LPWQNIRSIEHESIRDVRLPLQEFDRADEADWGDLRELTETEWNHLTEILDKTEQ
tara:strand:+ start:105356 stop:105523 length:168 start_codon:yes stop_codon:yes gene_type:complete